MSNKMLGSMTICLALLILFSTHEYAWIISAILLGVGSGIFLKKE